MSTGSLQVYTYTQGMFGVSSHIRSLMMGKEMVPPPFDMAGGPRGFYSVWSPRKLQIMSKYSPKKNTFYRQKLQKIKRKMFSVMFILGCMVGFLCQVRKVLLLHRKFPL
jgi:hypothetical protein